MKDKTQFVYDTNCFIYGLQYELNVMRVVHKSYLLYKPNRSSSGLLGGGLNNISKRSGLGGIGLSGSMNNNFKPL